MGTAPRLRVRRVATCSRPVKTMTLLTPRARPTHPRPSQRQACVRTTGRHARRASRETESKLGLSTDTPHRWSPWAPDQDSRLAYSTKVACNSFRKPYKSSIYNKRVRPPAPFPLAAHTTQVSPRSPPRGRGRRRDPPSEPPLSPLAVSPRELSLRCSPPHRHTSIHTHRLCGLRCVKS